MIKLYQCQTMLFQQKQQEQRHLHLEDESNSSLFPHFHHNPNQPEFYSEIISYWKNYGGY